MAERSDTSTSVYCEHCGARVGESFRFCPECGGRRHGNRPDATGAANHTWARDPLTVAVVAITLILTGATALWLPYKDQVAASDPSEADTRQVFEHQRPELQNGAAELLTFKKLNSASQEILGVIVHFADYEAEIAYPTRGETETITGQITFKLTDEGWLGEDGQHY
jgi:hypothetical protein